MKIIILIFLSVSAKILPDVISQLFYPGKEIKLLKRSDDDFRKSLLMNILGATGDNSQDSSLDSLLGDLLTNG